MQVEGKKDAVIVVAGEDDEAVVDHVVAGVLWLVSTDEKVYVQKFAQRFQRAFGVITSPHKHVGSAALAQILLCRGA